MLFVHQYVYFHRTLVRSMKRNGAVYVTSTNILHLFLYLTFTRLPFLHNKNKMCSSGKHPVEIHRKKFFLYAFENRRLFLSLESHKIIDSNVREACPRSAQEQKQIQRRQDRLNIISGLDTSIHLFD